MTPHIGRLSLLCLAAFATAVPQVARAWPHKIPRYEQTESSQLVFALFREVKETQSTYGAEILKMFPKSQLLENGNCISVTADGVYCKALKIDITGIEVPLTRLREDQNRPWLTWTFTEARVYVSPTQTPLAMTLSQNSSGPFWETLLDVHFGEFESLASEQEVRAGLAYKTQEPEPMFVAGIDLYPASISVEAAAGKLYSGQLSRFSGSSAVTRYPEDP